MLINISNHPSTKWSDAQKKEALSMYDLICDIPFPDIDPLLTEVEITDLVQRHVQQVIQRKPKAVHVMGEMNFTYKCVSILKNYGIKCVASTTSRNVSMIDNQKITIFEFVQFREY